MASSITDTCESVSIVSSRDSRVSQQVCMPSSSVSVFIENDQGLLGALGINYYLKISALLKNTSKLSILHDNGMWQFRNVLASRAAMKTNSKFVLSPRGMLEKWSLSQGQLKKTLATALYQKAIVRQADCIFATSEMEAVSVRSYGFGGPIAVIPNGIQMPEALISPKDSEKSKRRVLFLSRLHKKKGVVDLVEAWIKVRPMNMELIIAGNDDDMLTSILTGMIRVGRVENSVSIVGPVYGVEKDSLFRSADLFILPSYSENFGIVVAEAMSYGIPAIATKRTPWALLEDNDCGFYIDEGVDAIVHILKLVETVPSEKLREMGLNARSVIESSYSWDAVGAKAAQVYDWLLSNNNGNQPDVISRS